MRACFVLVTASSLSENEIRSVLAAGANLDARQASFKCGSSGGSCVPELKRLVAAGKKAFV
ncbi:hypothetical protein GCM10027046_35220 [Uliginosibacterium flavum]